MASPPKKWDGKRRSRVAYGKLNKTRKLLRRLPKDLTDPIRKVLADGAAAILADAKAGAPRSAGGGRHAADSLSMRISRDGLRAEVGIIGKRARKRAFYLAFHEFGTLGTRDGFGKGIVLPPIEPRPFLGPAFDAHAPGIRDAAEKAVSRALNTAAGIENKVGRLSGDLEVI